jgi:hypothetical protein
MNDFLALMVGLTLGGAVISLLFLIAAATDPYRSSRLVVHTQTARRAALNRLAFAGGR